MTLLIFALLFTSSLCSVITTWNEMAVQLINSQQNGTNSDLLVTLNIAIFNAVMSISQVYVPLNYTVGVPSATSLEAAAASAAHMVLSLRFPNMAPQLFQMFYGYIDALPVSLATTNGIYVGEAAAQGVLELANSTTFLAFNVSTAQGVGTWKPSSGAPLTVSGNWASLCAPFSFLSLSPPPLLNSTTYINDANSIYGLGALVNSTRTSAQQSIADFWNPPGITSDQLNNAWLSVAAQVTANLSTVNTALTYAMLTVAQWDSQYALWQAKNTFHFWRPQQAIRTAGVPQQLYNPVWTSLRPTPNSPEYPSECGVYGAVASQVFQNMVGSDNFTFTITVGNSSRQYNSFSAAANDQAQSCVYAGTNFGNSAVQGLNFGQMIVQSVAENCFVPTSPPGPNKQLIASYIFASIGVLGVGTIIGLIIYAKVCKEDQVYQ